MISFSEFKHVNEKSLFTCDVPRSRDFRVFIGNREAPVYTCRISKFPFNTWWPGHQRYLDQSQTVSFVNIVADEAVMLTVEPLCGKTDAPILLKPYSKGVIPESEGGKISVTLRESGGYVLELGDYHNLLYIFCSKPVACENPEAVTHYFGPGVHIAGKITLKSGDVVYADKDAYIYGNIFADGAENIKIYGNGIFDDSGEERFSEHCYEDFTIGNIKLYDCKNVKIEGVGFTNSAIWCVNIFHCIDVEIDGVKVFGQWRYNTDGIDIVNSSNVKVLNSFVHSFDDTITVKGIDRYSYANCENILAENCTLWCDWGRTLEIGLETNCETYKNITFRNCDLLRGGSVACDIQNGDCAEIENITFEDIRIELESFYTSSVLQTDDDMKYEGVGTEISEILNIQNVRFRTQYSFLMDGASSPYPKNEGEEGFASVKNVTLRDIKIICDEKILRSTPKNAILKINLKNVVDGAVFSDIRVENVSLNGAPVKKEDMSIVCEGDVEGFTVIS